MNAYATVTAWLEHDGTRYMLTLDPCFIPQGTLAIRFTDPALAVLLGERPGAIRHGAQECRRVSADVYEYRGTCELGRTEVVDGVSRVVGWVECERVTRISYRTEG